MLIWLRKYLEVILATILAVLGVLDERAIELLENHPWIQAGFQFAYDYKIILIIPCALMVAGLATVNKTVKPSRHLKETRQSIMAVLMRDKTLFPDSRKDIRVTIFQPTLWYLAWGIYCKEILRWACIWRSRHVRGRFPRKGNYLRIVQRDGKEHPNSKTYFYVDPDDPKKTQGIAGRVWHYGQEIHTPNLPDISNIDLYKLDIEEKNDEASQVRAYMKRGHVDYRTLTRLKEKARHFYGTVLYNNQGAAGVMVVDSMRENPFLTDDSAKERLQNYAEIIGYTL